MKTKSPALRKTNTHKIRSAVGRGVLRRKVKQRRSRAGAEGALRGLRLRTGTWAKICKERSGLPRPLDSGLFCRGDRGHAGL